MERGLLNIPFSTITSISRDIPINPDIWLITGLDATHPEPTAKADFAHGIVTLDDPNKGVCILVNKDGGDDKGHYFNIIGGGSEQNETPRQTFTREMIEETGITPDDDRLSYAGLIQTTNAPATPLFRYHIQKEDLSRRQKITGSEELALIPLSVVQSALGDELYHSLFSQNLLITTV